MDSEPRWLDIQDQLYPQIVMLKQIIFENAHNGELTQFFTQITYNSFKRQIDITPVIFKYFIQKSTSNQNTQLKQHNYEIFIRDKILQKLHFIGFFPNDDTYYLGQQFLSEDILYLIIKTQQKAQSMPNNQIAQNSMNIPIQKQFVSQQIEEKTEQKQEKLQIVQIYQSQKSYSQLQQNTKSKLNKRRTIQQILKIVAQWRKLIMIKKISPIESADKVGMSKRSLEDYFTTIKLGQKYGFDFQGKMKNGFAELRNFVKENHQAKSIPKVQILEKFKNIKK